MGFYGSLCVSIFARLCGVDSGWKYVAEAVKRRREWHLGATQQEIADRANDLAGKQVLSVPTLQILENARQEKYRPATLLWLARALDWPDDAIERIRSGERPEEFTVEIDLNSAAAELTADERRAVLDFIAEQRRKQQS